MNTMENTKKVTQSYDEQQNPPTENGVSVAAAATYFYAVLDDNDIVTEVMSSPFPAPESYTNYILIDSLDETLVGKLYDRETQTFIDAPIISCDASNVSYEGSSTYTVDKKIADMDEEIALNTGARHAHENQTVLDGITAEKVAAWDAGTGSTVDAYTKDQSDAKYALIGAAYTKDESDAKYAPLGATGATMSGAEILEALDLVDGAGSGLDADTLDGKEASDFALADHTHEGYAATDHTHTDYAAANHEHTNYATVQALNTLDSDVAQLSSDVANFHSEVNLVYDELNDKAEADHTHTGYANASHTHTASEVGAANANHTHTASEVGAAASNHTHSGYATSNHTHSDYADEDHSHSEYFEKTGGTISGETNFSGGLIRTKGVQAVYHSGSQLIYGSNNLPTRIAGSAISSTKTITVDSDKRLKKNIELLDKERFQNFMKKVKPVAFNYIVDADGTQKQVGVIAQQLIKIDPEVAKYFVKITEEGYYSVDYTALALMAALAIQ